MQEVEQRRAVAAACVSFALHISEAFQALAVQKLPVTG
jgi:hypothetical protein